MSRSNASNGRFNVLQGVGGIVSIYFTQYYMKDVVMASSHGVY